jgi:hypothetical protein
MKRPVVRDKQAAVLLGIGCFGLGWFFLYDAWEARGGDTPPWFRWATWW